MPDNGRNESRHSMPENRRKKEPDDIRRNGHRKKGHTKKRRDVDVRNGRGMVAGLTRKWANTTPGLIGGAPPRPSPWRGGTQSGLAGSLFLFGGYFTG